MVHLEAPVFPTARKRLFDKRQISVSKLYPALSLDLDAIIWVNNTDSTLCIVTFLTR